MPNAKTRRSMIRSFTDHAANERTYLAWVRTAVALMGLGFVIERFDLFVRYLAASGSEAVAADPIARIAGLVLILFGVLVLVISTVRYLGFKRLISDTAEREFGSSRSDLVLVAVVCLLGALMSLYLVRGLLL
jgi:putative membrane protein